jgi:hypothetical protein
VKSVIRETDGRAGTKVSDHAKGRMQKRSIRNADLVLLLFGADREAWVGGGCVALSISRKRLSELRAEGFSPSVIERAAKIAAVEASGGGIVTVLRPRGYRGRRYRGD